MKRFEELRNVPQEWLGVVLWWLRGVNNDTDDMRTPQLRRSIADRYQLFIGLYSLVVAVATVFNIALVITICRRRLYHDQTFRYLLNLALSNIAHGCLVIPLSMVVMLLHNWLFGASLCHLVPILQDIPLHASTLTHMLIVWDRLFHTRRPTERRFSALVMSAATWLLAVLVVLPYYRYTTYIDLGVHLKEHFDGVGICVSNLTRGIRIYARALVIIMYVVPVCVILRLHLSLSAELHRRQDCLSVVFDAEGSFSPTFHREEPQTVSTSVSSARGVSIRERRLHECLAVMAAVHCICLCPLMVLRIAKSGLNESDENSGHFDILFSVFVWLASLHCATSPLIFLFIYSDRSLTDCVWKCLRITHRLITTAPGFTEDHRPADTPARSLIQPTLTRESRQYCTTI